MGAARYAEVVQSAPIVLARSNTPVTEVSWFDALRFCNHLSELEGREP